MSKNITPYKDSALGKKEQVAKMFDAISGNYDNLNRVISAIRTAFLTILPLTIASSKD